MFKYNTISQIFYKKKLILSNANFYYVLLNIIWYDKTIVDPQMLNNKTIVDPWMLNICIYIRKEVGPKSSIQRICRKWVRKLGPNEIR